MTREETASVLGILRAAYPAFYSKMRASDADNTVNLWAVMFRDDDINIVKAALYKLIETHTGYPPDIAAVKAEIKELVAAATGEPTDEELWIMLKKAVSNGVYGAQSEFKRLPPILQRYLGTPATLREMASGDVETLNTVVHGQFLKQIPRIRDRQQYADSLPEGVKTAILSIYAPIQEDAQLTEGAVNQRRNEILNQLEARKG